MTDPVHRALEPTRVRREAAVVFLSNLVSRRSGVFVSLPTPTDSGAIVAPGPDAQRILLFGSGIVTGSGIASHVLGAGGHLARLVSAETQRGVELDVVPVAAVLVKFAPRHLAELELSRYDAIILAMGLNDALTATPPAVWHPRLLRTLELLKSRMSPGSQIFLIAIADPRQSPLFRRVPARIAWAHARALNRESRRVVASEPDVTLISFEIGPPSDEDRLYDSSTYLRWARQLAPSIVAGLRRSGPRRP